MQALKLLQMESQRRSHLPRSPFPTTTEVHGNSIVGTILSVALLSLRRVLGYSGQLLGGFFSPSKFTNENSLFRFNKTRMCRDTLWHEVKRCYFFFLNKKPENRLNCYKEGTMPGPGAPGWWKDTRDSALERDPSQNRGWGGEGPASSTSYTLSSASRTAETTAVRADRNRGEGWGKEQSGKDKGVWERKREKWGGERDRKGSRWRRCSNISISWNASSLKNFRVTMEGICTFLTPGQNA